MKYLIVEESDRGQMIETVQSLVDIGWRPKGGIAVAFFVGQTEFFYQAMTLSNLAEAKIQRDAEVKSLALQEGTSPPSRTPSYHEFSADQ